MKRILTLVVALLTVAFLAAGCGGGDDDANDANQNATNQNQDNANQNDETQLVDLVATLEAEGDYSTLIAALEAAELTDVLQGEDEYTVFAPTDEAFDALPEGTLDSLLEEENQDQLEDILLYHVLSGTVTSDDVSAGEVTTAAEIDVEITVEDDMIYYGGALISDVDVEASNGVIHTLDEVALPPTEEQDPSILDIANSNDDFSLLAEAVTQAGLADALDGEDELTVFAPTDAAFQALLDDLGVDLADIDDAELADILTYHALEGEVPSGDVSPGVVTSLDGRVLLIDDEDGLAVNGSSIVDTDIEASNGVIHVIDEVIVPPGNLVDVAVENDFTELAGAVEQADLVDTLSGEDHYTVFAPTNEAFEQVSGVVEGLSDAELADVLLYHVVAGAVSSYEVAVGPVETALGVDAEISSDGGLFYDGAEIIMTDVVAENGIIHVIDAVVLPPE